VMKFTIPVPRAFPVHPSKNDEERLLAWCGSSFGNYWSEEQRRRGSQSVGLVSYIVELKVL
jgi:hypothetical protein